MSAEESKSKEAKYVFWVGSAMKERGFFILSSSLTMENK